ncbi:MAG: hypothetical protein [Bacteriophage sp.]|nr:MAG: hypothetical protein [Bacteriophage sp.]
MSKLKVGDRVYHKFNEHKGIGKIIAAHGTRFLVDFPERFLYVNKVHGLFMTVGEWCCWYFEEKLGKYCEESEMKFVSGEEVLLNGEKFRVYGVERDRQVDFLQNTNCHRYAHVSKLTPAPKKIGKFKIGDCAWCNGKRVKVLGVSSIGDYVMYGVVAEDNSTLYSVAERYLSSLSATELLKEKGTLEKQLTASEASYAWLKEKYDSLKSDYAEAVDMLSSENKVLVQENHELKDRVSSLEIKLDNSNHTVTHMTKLYDSLFNKYISEMRGIQVGDKVRIVQPQLTCDNYEKWLNKYAPELLNRCKKGGWPYKADLGIVMAKGWHEDLEATLYAVLANGAVFIMPNQGIERVNDLTLQ